MVRKGQVSPGRWLHAGVLGAVGALVAGGSLPAAADTAPSLGVARGFAVLGASTLTNTGSTTIVNGNAGVSPGSEITGFGPGQVTGGTYVGGQAKADEAHADAQIAYDFLAGMASIPANNLSDLDLGGMTLAPGVWKFNGSAGLTGAMFLDAGGNADAEFVIQIATTLTTAPGASVTVINGGGPKGAHVFWQVGSSATLGSGTAFVGNILAYASITLETGASLHGNALALVGAVTLDSNVVISPYQGGGGGGGGGIGRPSAGRTVLLPPGGGPIANAFARLDVKYFPENNARDERSWFRFKMGRLDGSTEYTIWADDPATLATDLVSYATFTTNGRGKFNEMRDTKHGDALPFGATLADLADGTIEVRDAAGTTTILAGTIPTLTP